METAELNAHPLRELLVTRLRARRDEIEQALMARTYGVSEPPKSAEPEYLEGLRAAVAAAFEYGLAALELGGGDAPPLPAVLLIQARLAARNGVQLGTVVRRYVAGYTLLGNYIAEEARTRDFVAGDALNGLLGTQATVFDRLIAAVSDEHTREMDAQQKRFKNSGEERIQRLLGGERLDTADIAYDFDAHHLGVIASGPAAMQLVDALSNALKCRLLTVRRDDGTAWAWFGSCNEVGPTQLERHAASIHSAPAAHQTKVALAIGEAGRGLGGWRLTHRQARAALPIAKRSPKPFVRYADVALLASMLQDDLLATSLRELYLAPLQQGSGGDVALQTLRAYIDAQRNVSSAAAALGVNRNTVANRLRGIERRIGRPLSSCGLEIEAALRLDEVDPGFDLAARLVSGGSS